MVFNRQSKAGKLGHKNTIYNVCDNCNREMPLVAALPSASPKQSSVKFPWVSSVKYFMNFVLFPVAQSHMAK